MLIGVLPFDVLSQHHLGKINSLALEKEPLYVIVLSLRIIAKLENYF